MSFLRLQKHNANYVLLLFNVPNRHCERVIIECALNFTAIAGTVHQSSVIEWCGGTI